MNIMVRIVTGLIVLVLIAAMTGYLLYFRGQKVEVGFIPNAFQYCGKVITGADPEYREIVDWLHSNTKGWMRDWHMQIAGATYHSSAFLGTVFPGGVSVSYKTETGFPRFIKQINHNLSTSCEERE
ncbi:hypothetical protein [Pseudoalteromonas rubra]|uniref:Uncharacterized protein n=1 Tax=Pseudoalteromonas rubra TaxID=43658 RepID=A0A0U3GS81_9GAMM|nr:hypothetical protein [Pseudoalteromonas rubra]ALU45867.1 hypothetical protein AT705_23360 [Pseudoalteromonas rubra]